jgi:hypothetical protein
MFMEKSNASKDKKLKHKFHQAKDWVIQHKTEIIICGGFALCVVAGVLVYKKINVAEPIFKSIATKNSSAIMPASKVVTVSQTAQLATPSLDIVDPINAVRTVCEHPRNGGVRNLPEGRKASLAKITEAIEKGIVLEEGQTLVNSCIVGSKCA